MNSLSSAAEPTIVPMAARTLPPALANTQAVKGPLRRLDAARARLEAAQVAYDDTRRQAVVELVDAGLTYSQIGELIGVSRARAFQIARGTR